MPEDPDNLGERRHNMDIVHFYRCYWRHNTAGKMLIAGFDTRERKNLVGLLDSVVSL